MSVKSNGIIKLPKSIYLTTTNKYIVLIRVKKNVESKIRQISAGTYSTLEEALEARDKFVIDNYQGITKGYMPRGIYYSKRDHAYKASLSLRGKTFYIGSFPTMKEAIDTRIEFIDSLK